MRLVVWIFLASALALVLWARGPTDEPVERSGAIAAETPAPQDTQAASSGYRITGANWSTDRTQPVYVPPHQRKALVDASRRKADAAARSHDMRTPLEESGLGAAPAGSVVANPGAAADENGLEIE